MCFHIFLVTAVAAGLVAPGAQAVLKQYRVNATFLVESTNVSPNPEWQPRRLETGRSHAVVHDDGSGNPTLKKFQFGRDGTATVVVPQLGGFIFNSVSNTQGPAGEFTGTGSTDATVAWGLLTGWTVTGTRWCHSSPSFICGLGGFEEQESFDPSAFSTFYDVGTWTFHGTGFTATPYVGQTFDPGAGNTQVWLRGTLGNDGRIPALPLLAVTCLGGSLVAAGLVALRRRER